MRWIVVRAAALLAVLGAFAPLPVQAACPGDCDGNGAVDVSELILGVNIALGNQPASACPAFDTDADGMVSVSELVAAVNAALSGCPATPTVSSPTVTPTVSTPTLTTPPSPTPTATMAFAPIFPADYRSTFIEVRACRLGIEHDSHMIRVLANPIAAEPYLQEQSPLPVGSIVIKEEFDSTNCRNDADLVSLSVMGKQAPGFDPADNDWHWQWVEATSGNVVCDGKLCTNVQRSACVSAGCHRLTECVARDYMCTQEDPRGTLKPVLESLPAALLSIAGTSPTDVYAVGADPNDGRGPYIVHYDGTGWRRLDSGATGALWWISVTPIDGAFYMAGENGLILQYTLSNHMFTRQTPPNTSAQLFGIWGPSATNLWAVGGDAERHGVLWHYDGESWKVEDLSAVLPADVPTTLYKVWGTSGTDVYAVGQTGVVIHYNGANWSIVTSGVTIDLFTLHGGGPLLAAVGGSGSLTPGVIIERQPNGSFAPRQFDTPQLNGIFVPPSGDAVAVGNGLAVAARTGSGWSLVNDGNDERQGRDFHGVWVDPDDGIWAVGGDLSISLAKGVLAYGGAHVVPGGPIQ